MFENLRSITASRDHVTTVEEARRKVEVHLARLTKRYADRGTISSSDWNDGDMTTIIIIKGQESQIVCSVGDETIDVLINLSLLAVPFRRKIEDRLDSELTKVLAIK